MITRDQKIRLGMFLVIGFSVLFLIIALLLGTRFTNRMDRYRLVFEDTSVLGVQVNSAVLYRGIRIGRIDSIEIDRERINNIIIYISVNRGTPIKADQEAAFVMVGITGLRQIEIRGGTDESPYLKPGDTIRAARTFFENVSDRTEALVFRVEQLLDNLISLTSSENQDHFDKILTRVEDILTASQDPIIETVNNINTMSRELAEVTTTLAGQISNIITNVDSVMTDLAEMDLNALVTQINDTVLRASGLLESLNDLVETNTPDINATIQELRATIENLNEFTRVISEDPSRLLWRRRRN